MAPSDIKVTYSEAEEAEQLIEEPKHNLSPDPYENYKNFNDDIFGQAAAVVANFEPPRALPSKEQHKNGDLSDRMPPPDEVNFEDKIYTLEAMCDLDCGSEGKCLLEKLEKDSLRKRCLCPMGKTGEKCAFGKLLLPKKWTNLASKPSA